MREEEKINLALRLNTETKGWVMQFIIAELTEDQCTQLFKKGIKHDDPRIPQLVSLLNKDNKLNLFLYMKIISEVNNVDDLLSNDEVKNILYNNGYIKDALLFRDTQRQPAPTSPSKTDNPTTPMGQAQVDQAQKEKLERQDKIVEAAKLIAHRCDNLWQRAEDNTHNHQGTLHHFISAIEGILERRGIKFDDIDQHPEAKAIFVDGDKRLKQALEEATSEVKFNTQPHLGAARNNQGLFAGVRVNTEVVKKYKKDMVHAHPDHLSGKGSNTQFNEKKAMYDAAKDEYEKQKSRP